MFFQLYVDGGIDIFIESPMCDNRTNLCVVTSMT